MSLLPNKNKTNELELNRMRKYIPIYQKAAVLYATNLDLALNELQNIRNLLSNNEKTFSNESIINSIDDVINKIRGNEKSFSIEEVASK